MLCDAALLIAVLHVVVLCQALVLFRPPPHRFHSSLQLLCLLLTFPPFDRRFQDLTLPVCPTRSTACHPITVSLLRRLLDYNHLWCHRHWWWGFRTSLVAKMPCWVQVSNFSTLFIKTYSTVQMCVSESLLHLSQIKKVISIWHNGWTDSCHSSSRTLMKNTMIVVVCVA